jgi:hypothetical protein
MEENLENIIIFYIKKKKLKIKYIYLRKRFSQYILITIWYYKFNLK